MKGLASGHPLAQALSRALGVLRAAEDVREEKGQGLSVGQGDDERRLGSVAFCGAQAEAAMVTALHPGASLIAYRHGSFRIVLALGQALRPRARETIAALRKAGLQVVILSGDRFEAVAPIAAELGVTELHAGLMPGDKLALLEKMAAGGHKVLMVGDGLNDAPALAGAHVSLSPVSATHLAQAAADIVFLGESLAPVTAALGIARKARGLMLQNLWFAVLYNAVAVPIAIAGLATPLVAAIAMSGSSLVVTLNALRARAAGEARS